MDRIEIYHWLSLSFSQAYAALLVVKGVVELIEWVSMLLRNFQTEVPGLFLY